MQRALWFVVGITGIVTLLSAPPTWPAPPAGNPNVAQAGTLACPAPIGTQAVSFNERTEDNPVRYLLNDETVVPKTIFLDSGQIVVLNNVVQEYGLYSVTLLSTNERVAYDDTNTGSESFGIGPTGRLVECRFDMHFEWTGILDADLARVFEVEDYIGEDVRISIDFDSTVQVIPAGFLR